MRYDEIDHMPFRRQRQTTTTATLQPTTTTWARWPLPSDEEGFSLVASGGGSFSFGVAR